MDAASHIALSKKYKITYYSSDDDEEIEATAAATAMKNAAAAATAEAAALDMASTSPEAGQSTSSASTDQDEYDEFEDAIEMVAPPSVPAASSSARPPQAELNQI